MVIPKDEITEKDVAAAYKKLTKEEKKIFDGMRNATADFGPNSRGSKWYSLMGNKHSVNVGYGCNPIASRLNHSCLPNTTMSHHDDDSRCCQVHQDIVPDEELTLGKAYSERHAALPDATSNVYVHLSRSGRYS